MSDNMNNILKNRNIIKTELRQETERQQKRQGQ